MTHEPTSTLALHGLAHEPYGPGDLYNRAPTERLPHQPVAGQPTVLGVATWPADSAERVWVTWQVNGRPAGEREAVPAPGGVDRDESGGVDRDESASDASYWRAE